MAEEKRSDCPLVVFTGVIDSCGFIRHSRIYEGNKADASTLADMLSDPTYGGDACGKDAGIATVENLKLITEKGYRYVYVSRHQLKAYEITEEVTIHPLKLPF